MIKQDIGNAYIVRGIWLNVAKHQKFRYHYLVNQILFLIVVLFRLRSAIGVLP